VLVAWAHALPGVWSPTALTRRPGEAASVSGVHPQGRLGPAWTAIDSPGLNPRRLAHGCCWDPVNDRIYMYGGTPTGDLGSNLTQCDCYDPVTNQWTSVTPMLEARDWFKGICCKGKVYAIGGMDNSGAAMSECEVYNPNTNVWTAIASLPTAEFAYGACVYDSLIIVMGGYSGGAETEIYNTLTDTWTTGTAMAQPCFMGDCDVVNDTIYFLGGFTFDSSDTRIRKGGINPANPAQIAWSWGPALPGDWGISGRRDGPTVALNNKLYAFGGFCGSYADSVGYVFDPGTQTWDTMPTYPTTVSGCCGTARSTAHEIYGLAGELDNDTLPGYYRLSVVFHDVGVTQILAPHAIVQPGDTVTPSAWVKNFGTRTEGFRVMMRIGSAYTNWQDVYIGSLDSTFVDFSPWLAAPSGTHAAKCSTMLADDENDTNDACTRVFTVSAVAVKQPSSANAPRAFALDVPSPSREAVTIRYALPKAAEISLKLYDATGKLRSILDQGRKAAGEYSATFGIRHSGFVIASGIYFVRLNSPGFERTRKVVIEQ
jgi:hypothetical protein